MFVVTVEFELNPGAKSEFLPLMLENARTSLAVEAGCSRFDVCVDPERPELVFLYEVYVDRAAFDEHLASTHFKSFDVATRDLVSEKRVRLLELNRQ